MKRSLALAAAALLLTAGCGDEEPSAQDPGGAETSSPPASPRTSRPTAGPDGVGVGPGQRPGHRAGLLRR